MKRYSTEGIILRRVDYGEADRIVTFLTPDHGKVAAMARGVRKPKSKLAGGIELFSISQVTFLDSRGSLDQLVSSRLIEHFRAILDDYDVLTFAYKTIEYINKITEDDAGQEYYELLKDVLTAFGTKTYALPTIQCWFYLHLLRIHGHLPNLLNDSSGDNLQETQTYSFDVGEGSFAPSKMGDFHANEIKAWRILAQAPLADVARIRGIHEAAQISEPVLRRFTEHNLL